MQEDFDRIRLDHAFVIGALLNDYRARVGVFPFEDGTDSVPAVVIIGTADQERRNENFIRIRVDLNLRIANGVPAPGFARIAFHTMKEFQDELGRVLGSWVQVPPNADPPRPGVNLPPRCQFWFKRGDQYFLSDSDSDRSARVLHRSVKH